MTTGEKIKFYRNMKCISQDTLAALSGIGLSTIKKYELDIRNPKPDQILKISNALGISINQFMDFDIETVSDVLSLILKMDEQVEMNFEADKDENGDYIPSTVKMSFANYEIANRLAKYMKARDIQAGLNESKEKKNLNSDEEAFIEHTQELVDQIKLSVIDSNLVVTKGTKGITVKVYPAQ